MTTDNTGYDPKRYEKKWLEFWRQGGWFNADVDSKKPSYTILIPPPNVTDRLHMGHGLNNTIQDILARFKRMSGFNVCWLPGTDHAGIATQMMVEKSLEAQGKKRVEMGRDAFFDACVDWKDKNGNIIIDQLKQLGASCDWSRQAYTMDPQLSKAVRWIFVKLFDDGLIYRGKRLVNWDPKLQTAISDDEVENIEENGQLYYIRYPIAGQSDRFIEIATTRPETMLGDVAVAVNPDDERYQDLIGKEAILPFVGRRLAIIADAHVRQDFGTGCVKITPAHDPNDFAMGQRHGLASISIMDKAGCITADCPAPFAGQDRFVARKLIIEGLKKLGLWDKTENYRHSVPYSDRGKVPIEPMLSMQWYVKMSELAGPAIAAAKNGDLRFHPDAWKKTYLHWLENVQDWCISRQLWWGHRVPIWYCDDCQGHSASVEDPTSCSHCQSVNIRQDEDVLDTWFSSWLWPLSPFGWPEDTKDQNKFFPSDVLVTGAEIIYLWVARMVMFGFYAKNELCFRDVIFNAIICDSEGRKFSKTLGNGIDPLVVIDKYGADAVRFTCINLAASGGRVRMTVDDFDSGHRFVNKLFNAARFLQRYTADAGAIVEWQDSELDLPSKWLLSEVSQKASEISAQIEQFRMNEASETMFHLCWRSLCDWGLEAAKLKLEGNDLQQKQVTLSVLVYCFDQIMRIAAPFLPFITEEIWQALPKHPRLKREASLVIAAYPEAKDIPNFPEDAKNWAAMQTVIFQIRSLRAQAKVPPKDRIEVFVESSAEVFGLITSHQSYFTALAKVGKMEAKTDKTAVGDCLLMTSAVANVFLKASGYVDFAKEQARIDAEILRVEKIVQGIQQKLGNSNFVARAPVEVVEQNKQQLENMQKQLEDLTKQKQLFRNG